MGLTKNLTMNNYKDDISKTFTFWRYLNLLENMINDQAEVGDLLLCKMKKKSIIPGQGNSQNRQIDKVCILIKIQTELSNEEGELYVIRTGDSNKFEMIIETWDEFLIYKYKNLSNCWFRHLYCNRDMIFLEKTQEFLQMIRNIQEIQSIKKNQSQNKKMEELLNQYYT